MVTNISFDYGVAGVLDKVAGETSRHASFLRYQDGSSAYDALLVHTNDKPIIEGFIADAFRSVLARFSGEGKYEINDGTHSIGFYLPDFDNDLYGAAHEEILRYVVLSTTASWLVYRTFAEYAKIISTEAEASLFRVIEFLRSRKFPIE